MAVAAGLCETVGGALLALGLATPLAGALLAIVMINAIGSVTLKRAFMLGSELEIAYLTVAVALAATGPGRFSLDRAIGWDDNISGAPISSRRSRRSIGPRRLPCVPPSRLLPRSSLWTVCSRRFARLPGSKTSRVSWHSGRSGKPPRAARPRGYPC
jgi:hypothetical protein